MNIDKALKAKKLIKFANGGLVGASNQSSLEPTLKLEYANKVRKYAEGNIASGSIDNPAEVKDVVVAPTVTNGSDVITPNTEVIKDTEEIKAPVEPETSSIPTPPEQTEEPKSNGKNVLIKRTVDLQLSDLDKNPTNEKLKQTMEKFGIGKDDNGDYFISDPKGLWTLADKDTKAKIEHALNVNTAIVNAPGTPNNKLPNTIEKQPTDEVLSSPETKTSGDILSVPQQLEIKRLEQYKKDHEELVLKAMNAGASLGDATAYADKKLEQKKLSFDDIEQALNGQTTPNIAAVSQNGIVPASSSTNATPTVNVVPETNAADNNVPVTQSNIGKYDVTNPIAKQIRDSGNYAAVKAAAISSGIDPEAADKIAIDQLYKAFDSSGNVNNPNGIPSQQALFDLARQSPEYQAIAKQQQEQASIAKDYADLAQRKNDILFQEKLKQERILKQQFSTYDAAAAKIEAQKADMRKQILEDKIDPNKYWEQKSGIQTAIASILGILGKAAGGRESVQDWIQDRIKENVNLQMKNLDRKQTILGDLNKAGNDLGDSIKLTEAFYKQLFAIQLERALTNPNIAGAEASLQARQIASKLQIEASKTQMDILKKQVEALYLPYKQKAALQAKNDIDSAEYLRLAQQGAISKERLVSAEKRGQASDARAEKNYNLQMMKTYGNAVEQAAASGKVIKPSQLKDIKPEQRGWLVPFTSVNKDFAPDAGGRVQMAISKESAQKIRKGDAIANEALSLTKQLEDIAKKHNYTGMINIPRTNADIKKANQITQRLVTLVGQMSDAGVIQVGEVERFKSIIPSAEDLSTQAYSKGAFNQFNEQIRNKFDFNRKSNLVDPNATDVTVVAPIKNKVVVPGNLQWNTVPPTNEGK